MTRPVLPMVYCLLQTLSQFNRIEVGVAISRVFRGVDYQGGYPRTLALILLQWSSGQGDQLSCLLGTEGLPRVGDFQC